MGMLTYWLWKMARTSDFANGNAGNVFKLFEFITVNWFGVMVIMRP